MTILSSLSPRWRPRDGTGRASNHVPASLWETAKSLASSWASTAELRSDCWIFLKTAKDQTRCRVDEGGSSVLLRAFQLVMAWIRPAEADKDSGGGGGGSGRVRIGGKLQDRCN